MSAPNSCPTWCSADHQGTGNTTHSATFGPFEGPGQVQIAYRQAVEDSRPGRAHAHLTYLAEDRPISFDLYPVDAWEWGNVIAGLGTRSFSEFATALRDTFYALDDEPEVDSAATTPEARLQRAQDHRQARGESIAAMPVEVLRHLAALLAAYDPYTFDQAADRAAAFVAEQEGR